MMPTAGFLARRFLVDLVFVLLFFGICGSLGCAVWKAITGEPATEPEKAEASLIIALATVDHPEIGVALGLLRLDDPDFVNGPEFIEAFVTAVNSIRAAAEKSPIDPGRLRIIAAAIQLVKAKTAPGPGPGLLPE